MNPYSISIQDIAYTLNNNYFVLCVCFAGCVLLAKALNLSGTNYKFKINNWQLILQVLNKILPLPPRVQ